jgi:hypothetical protein
LWEKHDTARRYGRTLMSTCHAGWLANARLTFGGNVPANIAGWVCEALVYVESGTKLQK